MDTKYNVIFAEDIAIKIEEIFEYICSNLFNETAANKLMAKLDSSINTLAHFPKMHPYSNIKKCRKCCVDNFIVFYRVDEVKRTVYLVDIFHGSQNYGGE